MRQLFRSFVSPREQIGEHPGGASGCVGSGDSSGCDPAPEVEDISHASRLLEHSKEGITKRAYWRIGEVVSSAK
ncbi:hypothetical protein V3D52_17680 [Pseudomonas putida]|uniref:hypothetical protein n=1 Tax=Pseudomonas putida TaxID=303 RepID=UPI0030D05F01